MTEVQGLAKLIEIAKQKSLFCLQSFFQTDGFQIKELGGEPQGHFQRNMVVILLIGADVHLTLKLFFEPLPWSALLKKIYSKEIPSERSESLTSDAFKELANLILGGVKQVLDAQGSQMSLSLPVLMRGYDNIFADDIRFKQSATAEWHVANQDLFFICSAVVQSKNSNFMIQDSTDERVDIEFF